MAGISAQRVVNGVCRRVVAGGLFVGRRAPLGIVRVFRREHNLTRARPALGNCAAAAAGNCRTEAPLNSVTNSMAFMVGESGWRLVVPGKWCGLTGVRLPKAGNMSALRAGAALVWDRLGAEFNAKSQRGKDAKRGDGTNR